MKLRCRCGDVIQLPAVGPGQTFYCTNCGRGYYAVGGPDGRLGARRLREKPAAEEPAEPDEPRYALRDSQLDLAASAQAEPSAPAKAAADEWPDELELDLAEPAASAAAAAEQEPSGAAPGEWADDLELDGAALAPVQAAAAAAPVTPAAASEAPATAEAGPAAPRPAERRTWWFYLADAWAYPFRGSAKWVLLGWCLLHAVSPLVSFVPFVGLILRLILAIALAGILAMYQFEMIRQSAYDATADPSLPRYEDFYESVLRPLGLQAAAWIGSGIPLMLAFGFARFIGKVEALQTLESLATGGPLTAWAGVLAAGLALSLFMFPMNLLAVAAADSAGAISPTFTFPAVAKVIGPYVVYYIFYVAVMAGAGALRAALPSLLVGEVVGVYAMTVSVRALGTLHYAYENRIGWTK